MFPAWRPAARAACKNFAFTDGPWLDILMAQAFNGVLGAESGPAGHAAKGAEDQARPVTYIYDLWGLFA